MIKIQTSYRFRNIHEIYNSNAYTLTSYF